MAKEQSKWLSGLFYLFILFILILGFLVNYSCPPNPNNEIVILGKQLINLGKYNWGYLPLVVILMIFIFLVMFKSINSKPVISFLYKDTKEWVRDPRFIFIPGYQLFSKKAIEAFDKGPTAENAIKYGIILFLVLTIGFIWSLSKILIFNIMNINKNWAVTINLEQWILAYFALFTTYFIYVFFINLIILFAIKKGYGIDKDKEIDKVVKYFNIKQEHSKEYWDEFTIKFKNFYGHKIWSGENVNNFIKTIQDQLKRPDKNKTSLWFLLESASKILEHNIIAEEGKNEISVKTKFRTSFEYSQFLANTMDYCSESMIWIVDFDDLNEYLLPSSLRELFISIAIMKNNETEKYISEVLADEGFDKKKTLRAVFRSKCKDYCICKDICKESTTSQCPLQLNTDFLEESITLSFYYWALKNYVPQRENYDEEELINSSIRRKTDIDLPHVYKFKSSRALKSRIINLDTQDDLSGTPYIDVKRELLKWAGTNGEKADWKKYLKKMAENTLKERTIKKILNNFRKEHENNIKQEVKGSSKEVKQKIVNIAKNICEESNINSIEDISLIPISFKLLFNKFKGNDNGTLTVGFSSVKNNIGNLEDKLFPKKIDGEEHQKSYDIGVFDKKIFVNTIDSDGERLSNWILLNVSKNDFIETYDPSNDTKDKIYQMSNFLNEIEAEFRRNGVITEEQN